MSKSLLKYIVLSDLHLGEADSLFTPYHNEEHIMTKLLSNCLDALVREFDQDELPMMILNGDILGLSFSTYQESLTVFDHFISSMTVDYHICDKVAYIPGNHDHHIWQLAVEDEYKMRIKSRKKGEKIPALRHTSAPVFTEGFDSSFLEAFISSDGAPKMAIKLLYPNMIISPDKSEDPYIVIHHGHFTERTYHFISNAMHALYPEQDLPKSVEDLEADNGSWIDFAFSELGRSGEAGERFEQLMTTLSSESQLDMLSDKLADNVAAALDYPYIPFHTAEKYLSRRLIYNIASKIRSERYQAGVVCSDEAMQGLVSYIDTYCVPQLEEVGWQGEAATLIWSHTHKPFSKTICTDNFDKLYVKNTGGWVLPEEPKPTHGGSILLINEHNEVQELRIWNDSSQGGELHLDLNIADGESLSPFAKQIMNCISKNGSLTKPWQDLKDGILNEIKMRRTNHNHHS